MATVTKVKAIFYCKEKYGKEKLYSEIKAAIFEGVKAKEKKNNTKS